MDTIFEAYVKRSIRLLRAAEGDAILVNDILNDAYHYIIHLIENRYQYIQNVKDAEILSELSVKKLEDAYINGILKEFPKIGEFVVASEIAWNSDSIVKYSGIHSKDLFRPVAEQAVKRAAKKEFQGKIFDDWVDNSLRFNKRSVKEVLKKGYIEGKSISEVVAEINRISRSNSHDVKTITRSFFSHNASEAKQAVFDLNPEILEGRIWNSTLDHRTTPLICGLRDQKEYDMNYNPIGHDIPWGDGPGRIHFNCRSVELPKIKGVDTFSNRPAVVAGENYERGDNETKTGRVRKPTKQNRESGIFQVKQITTRTDYEGFLRSQARKNIDYVSDILGSKENAILFRDGKVTLYDLGKTSPLNSPIKRNQL